MGEQAPNYPLATSDSATFLRLTSFRGGVLAPGATSNDYCRVSRAIKAGQASRSARFTTRTNDFVSLDAGYTHVTCNGIQLFAMIILLAVACKC